MRTLLLTLAACAELPEREAPPVATAPGDAAPAAVEHSGGASEPPEPMAGFSFVDDHVAGMPQPGEEDLPFLAGEGLTLLVTLTEAPMDDALLADAGLDALHLPIATGAAPTLEQQDTFVAEVERRAASGERVGAHCQAGVGRTGTMLATWFVAKGYEPQEAIDTIRELRPGSIEPGDQEAAVFAYAAARAR